MGTGRIKVKTEIELSIDDAARWFAGMTDDEQSRFFVAVDAAFRSGMGDKAHYRAESQWMAVGNHLATCECSSEGAREMIRSIQYGMDHPWTTNAAPVDLMAKAQPDPSASAARSHERLS